MENSPRFQENQIPGLIPSPKSYSPNNSSTSSSSTSGSNNTGLHHHHHRLPTTPTAVTPQSPVPITRSEPNSPYPTTFVQADSSSFKQVVQMLTGSSETAKQASGSARPESTGAAALKNYSIPPIKSTTKKDKSASRLYERRNSLKNFKLSPLAPGFVNRPVFSSNSPRTATPELLSPSLLDFPSLSLSPVTPLIPDPFNRSFNSRSSSSSNLDAEAEEKAIANKGFYFHPSPSTTPRESEPPRLLPLFPVTSPRVSGSISTDS